MPLDRNDNIQTLTKITTLIEYNNNKRAHKRCKTRIYTKEPNEIPHLRTCSLSILHLCWNLDLGNPTKMQQRRRNLFVISYTKVKTVFKCVDVVMFINAGEVDGGDGVIC